MKILLILLHESCMQKLFKIVVKKIRFGVRTVSKILYVDQIVCSEHVKIIYYN